MFQLTKEESENWKSQIATLSSYKIPIWKLKMVGIAECDTTPQKQRAFL